MARTLSEIDGSEKFFFGFCLVVVDFLGVRIQLEPSLPPEVQDETFLSLFVQKALHDQW